MLISIVMVPVAVASHARALPASGEHAPAAPSELAAEHEDPGGGGLCDRDPSACPNPADVEAYANRVLVSAPPERPRLEIHSRRFELEAAWSLSPSAGAGPHVGVRGYGPDRLALGLDGTLLWSTDGPPGWIGAVNLSWVPWATNRYQRSSDSSVIIGPNLDLYLGGGGALVSRRTHAASTAPRPALDLFLGLRFFVNRWFAMTLDARAYATVTDHPVDLFGTVGVAFFLPHRVYMVQHL